MRDQLLTKQDVLARYPISQVTLDRARKAGRFPQPIKLSARRIAWRESDLLAWEEKGGFCS